jgi:hypothetical protein
MEVLVAHSNCPWTYRIILSEMRTLYIHSVNVGRLFVAALKWSPSAETQNRRNAQYQAKVDLRHVR